MRLAVLPALLAAAVVLPTGAHAAETYFIGSDPGAGVAAPRPNSNAAAAAFDAAAGTMTKINFESFATGSIIGPTNIAPGVTLTNNGLDPGFTAIRNDTFVGYNTTAGGSKYLGFAPYFSGSGSLTFSFDTPIQAFGAYFTGLESMVGGAVRVQFANGGAQDVAIPKNSSSGAQFWGFVDPSAMITQISIFQGIPQNVDSRDIFGIDDIRIGDGVPVVPVPAAAWSGLSLLGAMGVVARLRRRKPE